MARLAALPPLLLLLLRLQITLLLYLPFLGQRFLYHCYDVFQSYYLQQYN